MAELPPTVKVTCPTCQRRFLLDETPTPPFCSERCQMVDLGRWLDEEYAVPHEPDPDEEIPEGFDEEY